MPDIHAARPRLVVDNSSSSESETPRSRARRSKGKCHSPGITSRTDHIPTPLRDIRGSRDARAAGPPKRPTIPETEIDSVTDVSIGTDKATNSGLSQAPIVAAVESGCGLRLIDHRLLPRDRMGMPEQPTKKSTRNITQATREMMARIRDLRMGKTGITPFAGKETSQDDFVKAFCDKEEFGNTAYGAWERNESPPPIYAIINFAKTYNISLDYLMRNLGEPQPAHIFQPPVEKAEAKPDIKTKPSKPQKRKSV